MKLWKIYQDVNDGYDTYDSAIGGGRMIEGRMTWVERRLSLVERVELVRIAHEAKDEQTRRYALMTLEHYESPLVTQTIISRSED
jgi:hypothetical protein